MKEFRVSGPFDIKLDDTNGHLTINLEDFKISTAQEPALNEVGCYVFTRRTPRGHTPIYIGKTEAQTLGKEAFTDRNQKRVCDWLAKFKKYRILAVWFVSYPKKQGKQSTTIISDVEKFLIQQAIRENADLLNEKLIGDEKKWKIRGVHNSGPGEHKSKVATGFKKMIGLS